MVDGERRLLHRDQRREVVGARPTDRDGGG
jgi:hypothetical protein